MPAKTASTPRGSRRRIVYAAGAILWRPTDSAGPEIAVIHRPRYDDWSLPKGKVDPGETAAVAAVREITEETGHGAILGRRLDVVSYPVEQGIKRVHYWAARSTGGDFVPGSEADDMIWLPPADAIGRLSYPQDQKLLRRFAKRPADTHTVLVVRHAAAGRKSRFSGNDSERQLDKKGRAQAEALVPQLLAFGATAIYAADRVRCHQTIQPLAQELGATVNNETSLTEESYAKNHKRGRQRILQIAEQDGTPVICTQGKVIPDLIAWWCERDGVRPDKSRNHKGSTWVMSLSGGKLIAADHIGGALAGNVRG